MRARITFNALSRIWVPVPDRKEDQNLIVDQIKEEEKKKAELLEKIKEYDQALLQLAGSIIPKLDARAKSLKSGVFLASNLSVFPVPFPF